MVTQQWKSRFLHLCLSLASNQSFFLLHSLLHYLEETFSDSLNAQTRGVLLPYEGDAQELRWSHYVDKVGYSPPAMARRASSSSGGQPSIVKRASERAPSPERCSPGWRGHLKHARSVNSLSSSRLKPFFTVYLSWWRQGFPAVHTPSFSGENINISAEPGKLCARLSCVGCPCWTLLSDATRWKGGGAQRSRVGETGGEDVAYLWDSVSQLEMPVCSPHKVTHHHNVIISTPRVWVLLSLTL